MATSILAQGMQKAVNSLCMKVATGSGAGANADLVVTGITTDDTIIGLIEIVDSDGSWIDHTSTASITDDDDVQSTVAFSVTTNDKFICFWQDASA